MTGFRSHRRVRSLTPLPGNPARSARAWLTGPPRKGLVPRYPRSRRRRVTVTSEQCPEMTRARRLLRVILGVILGRSILSRSLVREEARPRGPPQQQGLPRSQQCLQQGLPLQEQASATVSSTGASTRLRGRLDCHGSFGRLDDLVGHDGRGSGLLQLLAWPSSSWAWG